MNERIRELAQQANEYTNWSISRVDGPSPIWFECFNERFAELIVNECADIAFQFSMENKRIHPDIDPQTMPEANQSVYHCTCQAVGYEIREHFGVEE